MTFELHRVAVEPEGAFGVLKHDRLPFSVTLERTYSNTGIAHETKIPIGIWRCTPTVFHGGKPQPYATWEIHVPGFSRLLFHRGNLERDSDGCVLVAESFGQLKGTAAILDSAGGFGEFMRRAQSLEGFELAVTSVREDEP